MLDTHESDLVLSEFALYCWKFGFNKQLIGNAAPTISAKISAIKWFHKFSGFSEPSVGPSLELILRGFERMSGAPTKKKPI
jgi:hypothetical protein